MKKNGFISTSIIYTFFVIFLLLMIFLLNSYSRTRYLLEEFKYEIKSSFSEIGGADINLYFMVWNQETNEYEINDSMPYFGYEYESNFSYCKNGSSLDYNGGNISITASRKDSCYAYFKEADKDITLHIYTQETADSNPVLVHSIPDSSYIYQEGNCTNDATITWNNDTRKFTITSEYRTECNATFIRQDMDIILNFYKEDANGTHEYNGLKYMEIDEIPGMNYTFDSYVCVNNLTTINPVNGELSIESDGKDECNIYYNGGNDKVEIIIMQETAEGVSGYTTGKKYSRVYSVPSSGYAYVGYICDDSSASITFSNGTLYGEAQNQTICRAYFNSYSDNVLINYYLQTSKDTYEHVTNIPSLGYIYNKSKSSCLNGSTIKVENNIVYIDTTLDNEVCDVYFDMTTSDISVLVYVMNRNTSKYELGKVPMVGYNLYSAGCTNGASIEYINGSLEVTSEGPTVCTVYFR